MRIAYVTTDEVNLALAARVAAEFGAVISAQLPNDPPLDGLFDAVLYNLDDVPRDKRSALLEGFCRGKPAHPTAVHGYDITDGQARTLNRHGVAAARRLHRDLLRSLFTAARQSRETVPPDDAQTDLTWVNLVK
jgi:hypothetical protein